MTNQSKPNYILRLDHQFPFEQFGKKWIMYLPGFEGMYAISEDLCICTLDKVCIDSNGRHVRKKAKLKKQNNKNTDNSRNLSRFGYRVTINCIKSFVSKKTLLDHVSKQFKEIKSQHLFTGNFPFQYLEKYWIGYLKDGEGTEHKDYLVSDDADVLKLNNFVNTELRSIYKIKKWTLSQGYEVTGIKLPNGNRSLLTRLTLLKQVSKILEGMPDD